jgi:hypothetical protein
MPQIGKLIDKIHLGYSGMERKLLKDRPVFELFPSMASIACHSSIFRPNNRTIIYPTKSGEHCESHLINYQGTIISLLCEP